MLAVVVRRHFFLSPGYPGVMLGWLAFFVEAEGLLLQKGSYHLTHI
jgi:hypothetical protein